MNRPRILFLVAEEWYFWAHRLPLARATRDAGYKVIVATAPGTLHKQIEDEGFLYYPLRLRRSERNPWQEILTILDIASLYRISSPNLVHQVTIKPILYGSIAAKIAGIPAIVNAITGLGYVFTQEEKALLRKVFEIAYRICLSGNHVRTLFENPDDRQYFVEKHILQKHQAVVIRGSGVDTERFYPTPEPQGDAIVLLASRMLWDKGIGELVEAARLLKQRGVPGHVVLAGKPDPNNPASIPDEQLQVWHDQGVIEWVGHQSDMPALLARAHIACLPTSYREGIPMSLLEAASCARPIVTTDAPGCREIVQDGWNGFLIPPKDPVALAEALHKLLVNPELRKTMGQRGRELVVQHFSKEIVVEQTLAVYQELLGTQWQSHQSHTHQ